MASDEGYLTAVESIYDAATDPSLWPAALAKIAAPSGGMAFMSMRDLVLAPESWPIIFSGMEQSWLDAYYKHYASRVAWMRSRVPRRRPGTAVPSEAVISRSDLLRTEWYNDFMRPQELISGIGVTVLRDQGRLVSAGLYVPLASEARHAEHVALVQRLTPHLERALKVNRQLSNANFRWQAAEQSFDRLTVGVVLLSSDMRVQFANAEAERILGQHDGLGRDREGRLLAASANDDARLQASVRIPARAAAVACCRCAGGRADGLTAS
jgi:PAS domain-containing protein